MLWSRYYGANNFSLDNLSKTYERADGPKVPKALMTKEARY